MVKIAVTTYIFFAAFRLVFDFVRADAGIVIRIDHRKVTTVFLQMVVCVLISRQQRFVEIYFHRFQRKFQRNLKISY
jgi:hypothetical protein